MPFSNISSLTIPPVLVPEQDYFYWPCMSGEKYAPTIATPATGMAGGYKAQQLYPAIYSAALGTTNGTPPTITYPVMPMWKYSVSVYQGFTLSFRFNLGASITGKGGSFYFNGSGFTYYIKAFVGSQLQFTVNGSTFTALTSSNLVANKWYSVTCVFNSAGILTISVDGTSTTIGDVSASILAQALQPTIVMPAASLSTDIIQFYLAQLQITYA